MDEMYAAGAPQLLRGVTGVQGKTAQQILDDLRAGPYTARQAAFGSGYYFAPPNNRRGGFFLRAENFGRGPDGALLRATLHPRARMVTLTQLRDEFETYWRSQGLNPAVGISAYGRGPADLVLSDHGRFAAARGYDVIFDEQGRQWAVLNRTALIVERAPVAAEAAAVTSTKAAVARQAAIDKARAVGNLGADVLEQIENGMAGAALRTRITQTAARLGSPDKVRDALLAAVDDPAALRQAIAAALRGAKLDVIGDAGALARFDRKTMQAIDGTIADAAHVQVVRPGLSFRRGTERIQISKATVEPLTAAEVREIERRAVRAAARERNRLIESRAGTARLLAEVDELIAKGAEARIIRQRLDPALIGPEQPFANADPAILEALRKALDTSPAALRSAVTRATTKAGLKPVSKAGAKVKFDPATMESVSGVDIPAGAQVTVVTRGASVTLPDGTVLQLSKARVTAVAKPARAPIFPSRAADTADAIMGDAAAVRWHALSGPDSARLQAQFQARLAAVVDGDYGGITVRVEGVTPTGGYMSFDGQIFDTKTGRKIGEFDRVIRREPNGELVARHSVLEIDRKTQGSGFAEEFNENLYDWYRRSGIKRVELTANIDVGGYAWASKGFEFETAAGASRFVNESLKKIETALKRKTLPRGVSAADLNALRVYLDRIKAGDIPARAFDISQFGRRPGQGGKTAVWPGKWLMLKSEWHGIKHL